MRTSFVPARDVRSGRARGHGGRRRGGREALLGVGPSVVVVVVVVVCGASAATAARSARGSSRIVFMSSSGAHRVKRGLSCSYGYVEQCWQYLRCIQDAAQRERNSCD